MPKGVHNGPRGPKTSFHPAFSSLAFEQCLLGHQDERIAKTIGISLTQLERWKHQFPAFSQAFVRGRDIADGKVAKALYRRAIGFTHYTEKITYGPDGNILERRRFATYYPPDTGALAFYLGNRSRALWQTKPSTLLDAALGLEQMILAAVERREKRAIKTIEHEAVRDESGTSDDLTD